MTEADHCPEWVPPAGRAIWSETVAELAARGMLGRASVVQVAAYCVTWANYQAASATIERDGLTVVRVNAEGVEMGVDVSPWFKIQSDALARLRVFWSDWRLLPKDVKAANDSRAGAVRLLGALQRSGSGGPASAIGAGRI